MTKTTATSVFVVNDSAREAKVAQFCDEVTGVGVDDDDDISVCLFRC
jgi:hypothetical protein